MSIWDEADQGYSDPRTTVELNLQSGDTPPAQSILTQSGGLFRNPYSQPSTAGNLLASPEAKKSIGNIYDSSSEYIGAQNAMRPAYNLSSGMSTKNTTDTETPAAPTSGNMAGGKIGAIFDMVNQVISGVNTLTQITGMNAKAKAQKKQYEQSFAEEKRRFDKTFFENVRQYNLEFALKEYATRKGLQLQEAQQKWNEFISASNIRAQNTDTEKKQFDLEEAKSNAKDRRTFQNAFRSGVVSGLKGGSNA